MNTNKVLMLTMASVDYIYKAKLDERLTVNT